MPMGSEKMRKVTTGALFLCGDSGTGFRGARAAAGGRAVTDPNDPKFITAQTRKQGGVMPAEQLALVFDHLDHALKVFPAEKRIEGVTTLSFTTKAPIRTVILDLYPKYTIASISIDGKVVPPSQLFQSRGPTPHHARHTVRGRSEVHGAGRVFGHAAAGKASAVGRRHDLDDARPMASIRGSTRRSGAAAATCSTRASITRRSSRRPRTFTTRCPTGLMAPGNGALVSKVEKDGWTTWNWHARSIHTYGSVLNVGPYKVLEGDYKSRFGNTIPMRLYYIPGEEKDAAELFAEFPQTLDFWENVIGPYPWADQKMGVIRVPFSGLENQTLIGHSGPYQKTAFGWNWLLNHEFAHEWFANQLSNANYDDLWLHEGLGSYAQPLIAEYLGGELDYMAQLRVAAKRHPQRAAARHGAGALGEGSVCRHRPARAATSTPRAAGSRTRCAS